MLDTKQHQDFVFCSTARDILDPANASTETKYDLKGTHTHCIACLKDNVCSGQQHCDIKQYQDIET